MHRVLQTIHMKLILLRVWEDLTNLDSAKTSGIPEAETFGRNRKFSAFGLRFRPLKVKAEYGRNSRKALDFLLFVHKNIANVNYQW